MVMRSRSVLVVTRLCAIAACLALSPAPAIAEEDVDDLDLRFDEELSGGAPPAEEPGDAPTAAQGAAAKDDGIEVITVMANKRAEDIQDVPVSMTALEGAFIEQAGLTDFRDIQNYVPNLSIEGGTDTRSTSVRIRGIGSVGTNAGIDPSVGLFIDGVYQGRAGMSMGDLIDIDAVEVLRGPQGTLYGKNTAAGLISIRTANPSYDFSSMAAVDVGNDDLYEVRGSLNLPIADDRVATRFSGYRSVRDGWDRNLFSGDRVNDRDKWGIRNKWLFDFDESVSLLVAGDYAKEDSKCCVPDIITYEGDSLLWLGTIVPPQDPDRNPNFATMARQPGKPALRNLRPFDEQVDVDLDPENEVQIWGVQADLDLDLDGWGLNWLSAYRAYDTDSQFDGDFSQYNAVIADTREDLEQISSELRLQSPLGELFDFTAGLYFFHLDHQTVGNLGVEQDFVDIFVPFDEPVINTDRNRHETFSYAGYGQFNLNLSDEWRFTGGLRVSYEKKTVKGSQLSTSTFPAPPIAGLNQLRDEERDVTNVSGTARVQYRPNEDVMLYASFASGFKSGGFNQLRTTQTVSPEFDDEQALNYELGVRTTWFQRRLTLNLTGYFTDFEDFQAQSFDGTAISIRNAGTFYSYGAEAEFVAVPIENLQWRTGVALNITEYQDFAEAENTVSNIVDLALQNPDANGRIFAPLTFSQRVAAGLVPGVATTAQNLDGERLDNAPRWSLSSSLHYEWPIFTLPIRWVFHTDYSFRSSIFLNQDLDPNLKEDPLHLLAFRTGVRDEGDRWELLFWITNTLDEEYMVAGFDVPVLGGFAGLHGPPRQYGVNLRVTY